MQAQGNCSVCGSAEAWQHIGRKQYIRAAQTRLSDYERVRYDVLFDHWSEGADTVELRVVLCGNCGFVCYFPRPTTDEISEKYRYINHHPQSASEFGSNLSSDRIRSEELFSSVQSALHPGRPNKVLDPVTHINFFSPNSLRSLLEASGFQVLSCKLATFTRPAGKIGMAVKALARVTGNQIVQPRFMGCAAEKRLLNPGLADRLLRLLRYPRLLKNLL